MTLRTQFLEKFGLNYLSPQTEWMLDRLDEIMPLVEGNKGNDVNFLQVGQRIECGNCHPEKFEHCKTAIEKYGIKCNCICHKVVKATEHTLDQYKDTFKALATIDKEAERATQPHPLEEGWEGKK